MCQDRPRSLRSRAPHAVYLILGIALMLGLNGCGGTLFGSSEPAMKSYVLEAKIEPRRAARPTAGVLVVALPRAQPGFNTQLIAYTETPLAIDYYTKSEWVDSPAMMLAPLVEDAIADTGAFQAVVIPPSPSPGDVRLEIDIIRLQQEFMTTPSQVRLTLRAKLFDVRTGDVLGTQLFEAVETAPSEDAYGGVQASNVALKRVLEQLTDFVVSNAPQQRGRRS